MKLRKNNESGMVIVEATIVFPVMFLIIFLLMVLGNAYYQKCRVEELAVHYAIDSSAHFADPLLPKVEKGELKDLDKCIDVDNDPYRYIFGMGDINQSYEKDLKKDLNKIDTGLFSDMKPNIDSVKIKFDSKFIYSTALVYVKSTVTLPIRMLGQNDNLKINFSSRVEMPVSDTVDFIRNIEMIEHYMDITGISDKIDGGKEKIMDIFEKISSNIKNKFGGR